LGSIATSAALALALTSLPALARVPQGLEVCLIESSGPEQQTTIRRALYYALSDDPNDAGKAKSLFAKAHVDLFRLLILHCKVGIKDLRSSEVNDAMLKYYQYVSGKLMEDILTKLRSRSQ
jgi:hypothetical protein